MLPTGAKILRMLLCGFDTHRADVSVWIAGYRFQALQNAQCGHFIALLAKIGTFSI
jgi:hypothetical protein